MFCRNAPIVPLLIDDVLGVERQLGLIGAVARGGILATKQKSKVSYRLCVCVDEFFKRVIGQFFGFWPEPAGEILFRGLFGNDVLNREIVAVDMEWALMSVRVFFDSPEQGFCDALRFDAVVEGELSEVVAEVAVGHLGVFEISNGILDGLRLIY